MERPAPDAGTVGQEMAAAVEFAGTGAVRRGRLGGKERAEQGGHFGRPVRIVVATGTAWGPSVGLAVSTSLEVLGIELIEAATRETQFPSDGLGVELARTKAGQKVANEGGGTTIEQLMFFMAASVTEEWIFRLELTPAGAWPSRAATAVTARPAVCQASDGAQVASPQSPILR